MSIVNQWQSFVTEVLIMLWKRNSGNGIWMVSFLFFHRDKYQNSIHHLAWRAPFSLISEFLSNALRLCIQYNCDRARQKLNIRWIKRTWKRLDSYFFTIISFRAIILPNFWYHSFVITFHSFAKCIRFCFSFQSCLLAIFVCLFAFIITSLVDCSVFISSFILFCTNKINQTFKELKETERKEKRKWFYFFN